MVELLEQQDLGELRLLSRGDVARDLGYSNNLAVKQNRGHCKRNVDQRPIFALTHRIVVSDALAFSHLLEDKILLAVAFRRDQLEDGLTDDLSGFVAENFLCSNIPRRDDAIE